MSSERALAAAFVRRVRDRGFLAIKLSTLGIYGTAGWPDYLVLGPNAWVAFVELKTPTGKVTERQRARLVTLRRFGFRADVARSVDEAVAIGLPA